MNRPAQPPAPVRRRSALTTLRAALLFLFVWPLPIAAFLALLMGDLALLAGSAGPFALTMLAASLLRRGIAAREEGRQPDGPRRPLTAAAGLIGLSAFLAALFGADYPWFFALGFGAAAAAGMVLLFGLDAPAPSRPLPGGVSPFTPEERRLIEQSRARIASLESASARLASAEFRSRLDRVAGWARAVIEEIERDPRDLRRARKSLIVYLEGAEKVTARYLETHPRAGDQAGVLEESYRTLLDALERAFADQYAKLIENDAMDLDVQIEVLTKRLKEEGVR